MKNKIIILLFMLLTLFAFGCKPEQGMMHIEGNDKIIIQKSQELKVYYNNEEVPSSHLEWTLSDYNVASIEDGVIQALNYGVVVVGVIDKTDPTHYCSKTIEVIPPVVEDIIVTGVHQLYIDKTTKLEAKVEPSIIESPVVWESSNEEIIIVDDGDILAVGVGVADVIITCDGFVKKHTIEVLPTPTSITISGKNTIAVNEIAYLTFNIEDDITLTSNNNEIVSVVDNVVIGVKKGQATITAVKNSDNSVKGTIEINVVDAKINNVEMSAEEKQKIEELINAMSLEQLVGEMFNVGFTILQQGWGEPVQIEPSTGLPYAQFSRDNAIPMLEFIKDYKFGNFTIHSDSGKDRKTLMLAINTLKQQALNNTGVEPLISINSTGGYIMGGITSLPTNMALSNGHASTIQAVNELYGSELQALGINSIINKYMLNNIDYNSSLNTYGSNISKAMATASIASQGLLKNNVLMIPDLTSDYYYQDERSKENIVNTDWKLLETAVQNKAQIISLPLAVYMTNEGEDYYGLLNPEYMKIYLREELNYEGIVLLGHQALENIIYDENLYDYITLAVNLGTDMLNFDITVTNSRWSSTKEEVDILLSLYSHIIDEVNNGNISIERIKEAVTRILLVKLRNNIIGNDTDYSDFNYSKVASEITNYAPEFISTVGEQFIIEKEDDVLIISENYDDTGTQYSLGDNLRKFFEVRGYKNIDIYHYDKLAPETMLSNANDYDKIFIALSSLSNNSNVGFAANRMNYIEFMNQLVAKNPNVCIIATNMPNVLDKIPSIKNAILLYNYYEENFESLCKVLNNEVKK